MHSQPPEPSITSRLNQLLAEGGSPPLSNEQGVQFATYLTLLQKWNQRTNLTSIRDEEGILSRHFFESILCAHSLPVNVSKLLDYGSGAGFPGIPIALIRNDLEVTLAESQNKKSAFLREAVRTLGLTTKVHSGRAEALPPGYDCITLRAVDDMEAALLAAPKLLASKGWLVVMTTEKQKNSVLATTQNLKWQPPGASMAGTEQVILVGQNQRS